MKFSNSVLSLALSVAIAEARLGDQSPPKSSIEGEQLSYSKAADMVKDDIIDRINNASNEDSKSRGVLSHNIFAAGDEYLGNFGPTEYNDAINELYKPDSDGTRMGIDWEDPQFFGFTTDSTASNLEGTSFPDLKLEGSGCDGSDFRYTLGETKFPPTGTQCNYRQDDFKSDSRCVAEFRARFSKFLERAQAPLVLLILALCAIMQNQS